MNKKEPYIVIECDTEYDYDNIVQAIKRCNEVGNIEKQNEIYENFIKKLITDMSKEIEFDGYCRMVVSCSEIDEWKKMLSDDE